MTDDLTTLLADAGREPTIELDVAAVHAAGRRRATTRRIAVGTGALAVVVGLVGVVPALFTPDQPDIEVIDEVPSEDAAPAAPAAAVTPRAALAAELGRDLQLHRFDTGTGSWVVERTSVDGSTASRTVELPALLADPVVDAEGALYAADPEGALVRDGELLPVTGSPALPGGALPVGTDDAGVVVLTAVPLAGLDPVEPTLRVVAPDGTLGDELAAAAELPADGTVLHVAVGEGGSPTLVLGLATAAAGDRDEPFALLVGADGDARDLLAEPTVADALGTLPDGTDALSAAGLVGEEVWLAARTGDGRTEVLRVPFDPAGAVRPLATPDGEPVTGTVTGVEVADGAVVLLARREAAGDGWLAPLVVRPGMVDATADGAITELDAPGVPTLLPATGGDGDALAACATESEAPLNAGPSGFGGQVWWLCWDALSQLPEGAAHPFVATELFAGGDGSADATTVGSILQAWAAGPDATAARAGLSGGVDPAVASIGDVTLDGAAVTVDLVAGPEVGVLGTTTGGATFVQGLVGTVLQHRGLDTVTITLDGSCEGWFAVVASESDDAPSCQVYDRAHAPWSQGLAACAHDTGAINAEPTPGEVVAWRWCPDAVVVLPATTTGEGFVAVPAGVAVASPPTPDQLRALVVATLEPTDAGQDADGLRPAAGGLARLPDAGDLALTIDGGTVTVDWSAAYVEVLPLTAPFPAGLVETAIAGAVLQFDAFETVVFTTDGSCEAYGETGEGVPGTCIRIEQPLWVRGG